MIGHETVVLQEGAEIVEINFPQWWNTALLLLHSGLWQSNLTWLALMGCAYGVEHAEQSSFYLIRRPGPRDFALSKRRILGGTYV